MEPGNATAVVLADLKARIAHIGRPEKGGDAALPFGIPEIDARLPGPVLWVLERPNLFAHALATAGLHPDRVIHAESLTAAPLGALGSSGRDGETAPSRTEKRYRRGWDGNALPTPNSKEAFFHG